MIHVIIGTKAQLIKMAPLLKQFKQQGIEYNYISTGQHQATVDAILANFEIKTPDYVLYTGKDITSIVQMGLWFLKILFKTFKEKKAIFKNDTKGIVLVHGDTFSTLLGALMGRLAGLKVAHVESGLRSFNWFHPFPEELTRIFTFNLAHYFFCPNQWAMDNLAKYHGIKVNTQMNTLYDALQLALPAIEQLQTVEIPESAYAVATLHRFENVYNFAAIQRIVEIIEQIALKRKILFILHKPTEQNLRKFNFYERLQNNPNVEFRQRYDYFSFIKLMLKAEFIISDGGSNQEECYYLGKPILLLRKATERKEGLGENCVLSHYDKTVIAAFVENVESYRFPLKLLKCSPSQIIIESCKPFQ